MLVGTAYCARLPPCRVVDSVRARPVTWCRTRTAQLLQLAAPVPYAPEALRPFPFCGARAPAFAVLELPAAGLPACAFSRHSGFRVLTPKSLCYPVAVLCVASQVLMAHTGAPGSVCGSVPPPALLGASLCGQGLRGPIRTSGLEPVRSGRHPRTCVGTSASGV